MTSTAETAPAPATEQATDARVIGLIGAAHFVSHYYILVLPPLFTLVRADFGVSYVQVGLALTAFNLISALLQTPAGFLVDRVSARAVLIGGLLCGAAGLAGASLFSSFWGFVAMFALLGLGNTVYHPADYSLLSRHVSPSRMGKAYSIHTFSGMLGSAAAPATMLFLASAYGWRGAYQASALLGVAVAALLIVFGGALAAAETQKAASRADDTAAAPAAGWPLLFSMPVLMNLVFFVFLALANGGVQNYGVVVLDALHGTPLSTANIALTAYLLMAALGVLVGGYVATQTPRHDAVAITGLTVTATSILLIALFDLNAMAIVGLLALSGLANGIIMPSRDLLVRAVTPPGAFGKVFGFVTTGFNIGGMVSPILYGWLLDNGAPRGVFLAAVLFSLASIPTVMINVAQRRSR
jgi:FSR family fosmidomycin resistance protein-like MFS transporter